MSQASKHSRVVKRPQKLNKKALLDLVADSVARGSYFPSGHALKRMKERGITDLSIESILVKAANRKPSRDRFDDDLNSWSYCYEGKDLDRRNIRVAVAIEVIKRVVVVTVVDLDRED
jgi:hypothetical protein